METIELCGHWITAKTQRLHGKMPKEEFRQLTELGERLTSEIFRGIIPEHGCERCWAFCDEGEKSLVSIQWVFPPKPIILAHRILKLTPAFTRCRTSSTQSLGIRSTRCLPPDIKVKVQASCPSPWAQWQVALPHRVRLTMRELTAGIYTSRHRPAGLTSRGSFPYHGAGIYTRSVVRLFFTLNK